MYAVLIPYVKTRSGDALLLEVRSQKVRQPGEVCFPGGRMEPGETALEAAVRETCEEIGITSDHIDFISENGSIVMGDGRNVYTVSAYIHIESIEELKLSEDEVEEVFLLPTTWLEKNEMIHFDLANTSDDELPPKLRVYLSHYGDYRNTGETDYIEYEGHGIWGLTARIIKKSILHMIDTYKRICCRRIYKLNVKLKSSLWTFLICSGSMRSVRNMKSYIRKKRETKGWTQEELAARVGVSVPTISGWETGKSDISQKNLKKLAEVLAVTPTEIVAQKDLPELSVEDKEEIANRFMALNEKVDDVEDNSFTLEDRVILATDIAKSAVGFAFIAIGIGIWGAFSHTKTNLFISWFIPFMGVAFMIFGRAMIKIMEHQLMERKIRKESRK